jgi:hypothetical protein
MKLRMSALRISALGLCAVCQSRTNTYAQMASIEPYSSRDEKEEAVAEASLNAIELRALRADELSRGIVNERS